MLFNFAMFLASAVIVSGLLVLIDKYVLARYPQHQCRRKFLFLFEFGRACFPTLLLVWLLRSFVIQPYRVPTGSLEPTVMPGDFIIVSQFSYGLRFPIFHYKFFNIGEPKRGDIALFRWPVNPKLVFVKRVVGLPGDHIVYHNKVLTINGVRASQQFVQSTYDYGDGRAPEERKLVYEVQENLNGLHHNIFVQPTGGETQDFNSIVSPHEYFVMGDNRDDSDDSRTWGFVPEKNLIGRAFAIWMSWDPLHRRIRWSRVGRMVH